MGRITCMHKNTRITCMHKNTLFSGKTGKKQVKNGKINIWKGAKRWVDRLTANKIFLMSDNPAESPLKIESELYKN